VGGGFVSLHFMPSILFKICLYPVPDGLDLALSISGHWLAFGFVFLPSQSDKIVIIPYYTKA